MDGQRHPRRHHLNVHWWRVVPLLYHLMDMDSRMRSASIEVQVVGPITADGRLLSRYRPPRTSFQLSTPRHGFDEGLA